MALAQSSSYVLPYELRYMAHPHGQLHPNKIESPRSLDTNFHPSFACCRLRRSIRVSLGGNSGERYGVGHDLS